MPSTRLAKNAIGKPVVQSQIDHTSSDLNQVSNFEDKLSSMNLQNTEKVKEKEGPLQVKNAWSEQEPEAKVEVDDRQNSLAKRLQGL